MRARSRVVMACVAAVLLCRVVGCGPPPRITVGVDLPSGISSFEVEPCVPLQQSGVISFEPAAISPGSGSIQISPEDVQVTVAPGAATGDCKDADGNHVITATVRIAPADQVDTVCASGEEYGPYTLTLDANFVPVAVSPATIELTANTIDLLQGGEFSLCVEVVSSVSAQIDIEQLKLSLGL